MTAVYLLTLFYIVNYSLAYPAGAPATFCGRYVPSGHRNSETSVNNGLIEEPYSLEVTPAANGLFTVSLRSTNSQPFRGYVIQATQSWSQLPTGPSDIIGTFQPDASGQSQMHSCNTKSSSNFLTHTNGQDKTEIQASWQAPSTVQGQSVRFIATVVQDFANFFLIRSAPVNLQVGASGQGQMASSGQNPQGMPLNPPAQQPTLRPQFTSSDDSSLFGMLHSQDMPNRQFPNAGRPTGIFGSGPFDGADGTQFEVHTFGGQSGQGRTLDQFGTFGGMRGRDIADRGSFRPIGGQQNRGTFRDREFGGSDHAVRGPGRFIVDDQFQAAGMNTRNRPFDSRGAPQFGKAPRQFGMRGQDITGDQGGL